MLEVNHLVGFGAGGGDVQYIGAAYREGDGSITYPAGTMNGDLVVLVGVDTGAAMNTPSGYVQQAAIYWTLGYKSAVFTKNVAGESSISVTVGSGSAGLLVYRNAQVGAVGAFTESAYSDSTILLPSVTPQDPSRSMIVGMVLDRDNGSPIKPAACTARIATAFTYFGLGMADVPTKSVNFSDPWQQANGAPYAAVGILMEVKPK